MMLCTGARVGRACNRRCWKIGLLVGVLTLVCQAVYMYTVHTVSFHRGGHRDGEFDKIIQTAKKMRREDGPQSRPNATVAALGHNASRATDSADAAICLFRNLSTSPYRILAGNVRKKTGRLVIGIPSARRANTKVIYLLHTLHSLVQTTSDTDKAHTTIIVMLTDTNSTLYMNLKSSDVEWVANYLLTRYEEAPCDILLFSMLGENTTRPIQERRLLTNTTLFQHIGKFSSLENKMMPSVDALFKQKEQVQAEVDEVPPGVYPAAKLETSLKVYLDHVPSRAYDNKLTTFFWGKTHTKRDYFTLKFETPQNFSRILVLTGHPNLYIDRFSSSFLLVSTKVNMAKDKPPHQRCASFSKLVMLVDGQVDTLATGSGIPRDIMCLKIAFTTGSKGWSLLREIRLVP